MTEAPDSAWDRIFSGSTSGSDGSRQAYLSAPNDLDEDGREEVRLATMVAQRGVPRAVTVYVAPGTTVRVCNHEDGTEYATVHTYTPQSDEDAPPDEAE